MKSKLLGVLCFAVVCITLTLGLWPFHAPRNNVTWLKRTNGIVLATDGTVLSSGPLTAPDSGSGAGGSIEIWVQPNRWSSSATILTLYRPERPILFTLHQSLTDFDIENHPEKTRFFVKDAFSPALRQKKPVFVTVTSGARGMMVYLDGILAKAAPGFSIPEGAFNSRLILGDSPRQPDGFRGLILGLAMYNIELNGAEVLRHYRDWTGSGRPNVTQDEGTLALYLFDERAGSAIRNHGAAQGDLCIPEKYTVVDKLFLEQIWTEFEFTRSYWSGNLKNIIGFIPAGFCFLAYFTIARPVKRAVLATLILGALVSLTIEVFQGPLPTRDSGTTDIITNIIGTYVGVLCYRNLYPAIVQRFPWLGIG